MDMLVATFRILAALFGAGLVMAGWSEHVFFNEGPAETLLTALNAAPLDAVIAQLEIAAFYTIPAGVALAAMAWRGHAGLGRAMLIAALVGFVIEGTVVPAVYEAVPLSYLWTSVAWHGPITVGLGIFLMPRLLARLGPVQMGLTAIAAGLGWGIWTTWVWEGGVPNLSSADFAAYAAWTFIGIAVGYGLLHLARWPRVALHKSVLWLFVLVPAALFVMQGVFLPVGGVGLSVILAGLLYALSRWDVGAVAPERLRWRNLVILILMPGTAIGTYAAQVSLGQLLPQDDLIALTFALGLLAWLGCLVVGYRRVRASKTDAGAVAS
ncbi:MAG: hypothetical protein AAFX45_13290 [Pseudomonadota bacterium]